VAFFILINSTLGIENNGKIAKWFLIVGSIFIVIGITLLIISAKVPQVRDVLRLIER
jgi:hypothetical protein